MESRCVPQCEVLRGIVKLMGGNALKDEKFVNDDVWFDTGLVFPNLATSITRSQRRCNALNNNILRSADQPSKYMHSDLSANLPTCAQIIDPEVRFWEASEGDEVAAQYIFDVSPFLVVPGYIDIQINGGFGLDFSSIPKPVDELTVYRRRNPSGYVSEAHTYPQPLRKVLESVKLECHPQTIIMRERSMINPPGSPVFTSKAILASSSNHSSTWMTSPLSDASHLSCEGEQLNGDKSSTLSSSSLSSFSSSTSTAPRLRRVCVVDQEAKNIASNTNKSNTESVVSIASSFVDSHVNQCPNHQESVFGPGSIFHKSPEGKTSSDQKEEAFDNSTTTHNRENSVQPESSSVISSFYGYDFTLEEAALYLSEGDSDLTRFTQLVLMYGVTTICPTIISSSEEHYRQLIPRFLKYFSAVDVVTRCGGIVIGARMVGLHLEGPFISVPGAHNPLVLASPENFENFSKRYCIHKSNNIERSEDEEKDAWKHVSIVTLAPELEGALQVSTELSKRGVVVSAGHSQSTYAQAEAGIRSGFSLVTHMFNAMKTFHHRDPGLVGILAATGDDESAGQCDGGGQDRETKELSCDYSIIPDGIHAHPRSVRIAFASHPNGMIAITDAMCALGLGPGDYKLGEVDVTIKDDRAYVRGTQTLAGAIVDMETCVRKVKQFAKCSDSEAVRTATIAPARCLGMSDRIGSLNVGASADILLLDPKTLEVKAVIRSGQIVYSEGGVFPPVASV